MGPAWEIGTVVAGVVVSAVVNLLLFAFILGKRDNQITELATRREQDRRDMEREWVAAGRRMEGFSEKLSTTNQKIAAMTGKVNGETYRMLREETEG